MAAYFWLSGPSTNNDTLTISDGSKTLTTFDALAGTDTFDFGYAVNIANFTITNNPDGSVTISGASNGHNLNVKLVNFESIKYLDKTFATHTINIAATNPGGGTAGNDTLNGTTGNDTLSGLAGNDKLAGLAGNDTLSGGDGIDILDGGAGADSMAGGAGNDTYVVDNAGDVVTELPGSGSDLVKSSITFDLSANGANVEKLTLTGTSVINATGNALNNILTGNNAVNIIDGGAGNDILKGNGGNDKLIGGGGADKLMGGAGKDILNGGAGKDVLTGGGGNDTFVFSDPLGAGNIDTVMDFSQVTGDTDRINLSKAVFAKLGVLGGLNAAAFNDGSTPLDATDRIIYDQSSGALYYDADGSGTASAAQQFAIIGQTVHPSLDAGDFFVVA